MADEEFEIDIYGDGGDSHNDSKNDNSNAFDSNNAIDVSGSGADYDGDHSNDMQTDHTPNQSRRSESLTSHDTKPPQGVKRKSDSDDRPVDPGATTALLVSELNWWNTDDDIRGWIRKAHCEDEMKDITFSEHKVNGKSKGQAYVEFVSVQAATAAKRQMDRIAEATAQPGQKRHAVIYTSPAQNPFKTLPKDAPARAKQQQDGGNRGSSGPIFHGNNDGGGRGNFGGGGGGNFRGRFNRGGMNSHGGGFNNRNFSGNNMGGSGGFSGGGMGGFNNMGGGGMNMGGGFGFGGGRGGMNMGGGMRGGSGMRGGRGGGGGMNGMMGGMPMGGMAMGGMPGAMGGMNMMGGGMGFNGMNAPFGAPPFFGGGGGNSGPNDWQQNPHGAKRQRPE